MPWRTVRKKKCGRKTGRIEPDNVSGVACLDFHALHGFKPTRYTVHVNGPWCITFEFKDGDAYAVDWEQYH